jgi:hypothetical protein
MFGPEWTFFGFVLSGISISYALLLVSLNAERIVAGLRKRRPNGLSRFHQWGVIAARHRWPLRRRLPPSEPRIW